MQSGKGGMGSHKHGISGTPGRNAKFKSMSQFEANIEQKRITKIRRSKMKNIKYNSVIEVLKAK